MHLVKIDKIYLNAPILGRFKGCSYNSRATFNGAGTVHKIDSIGSQRIGIVISRPYPTDYLFSINVKPRITIFPKILSDFKYTSRGIYNNVLKIVKFHSEAWNSIHPYVTH